MSALLLAAALTISAIPMRVQAEELNTHDLIVEEQNHITLYTQSKTSGFSSNYTLNGVGANDMVAIALAQEGRTGSQIGYTEEWCANFVSDCAILAGQTAAVPQHGHVASLYDNVIAAGGKVVTSNPQPGDLCFINWNGGTSMGHVEIVYSVSGSNVYTIGGNSGSADTLYDRMVKKHAPLASKYILSIVRPAYAGNSVEQAPDQAPEQKPEQEQVVKPQAPEIASCYSTKQTSVKVTWTAVDGVAGYEIWRTTDPDNSSSWKLTKTVNDGASVSYTNQGLEAGVTYYYKVRSFNLASDGTKVYSDFSADHFMPATVLFNGPYSNSTSNVRLCWKAVDGAHGYQIWRMETDGTWRVVKTIGDKGNVLTSDQGSVSAYTNTGLTAGETYTYKMRAFTILDDGRKIYGAYSDVYSVAVQPDVPTVTVTASRAGSAQISWQAVNGATGYQIWMADAATGEFKIVKSVVEGNTSYTKYDLEKGKAYSFKVRAYAEVEGRMSFSAYSEMKSITAK